MKLQRLLIVLIWSVLITGLQAQPQEIRISGVAPGFKGEEIVYKRYTDRISYEEEILASVVIDPEGRFELVFHSKLPVYGRLVVGFHTADLMVLPGNTYETVISDSSMNDLQKPANSFIKPYSLRIKLNEPAGKALNRQADSLQNEIDRILLDTNRTITPVQVKNRYTALLKVLHTALTDSGNRFIRDYALYSLAPLDAMVNRLDDTRIWAKYIHNKPILYDHPVYMQFFNDYYTHYPQRRIHFIKPADLEITINRLGSVSALMDSLGKDSLLRNERLREFVAIKTLAGLYHEQNFSQKNISVMLNELSFTSKFPEHRTAAHNLRKSFLSMRAGESLPEFRLKMLNGDSITGLTYSGYPVYYSFITTWCEECTAELMVLKKLAEKYKGKIRFVTVVCNGNEAVAAGYLRQHPDWKWDFSVLNKQIELLQRLKIRSFPTFLLVGRSGEIIRFPAPAPSQSPEGFPETLFEKK